MAGKRCMRMLRTVFLMSVVGLGGWSMSVPALAQETATTVPQPPQDARRYQGERQGGAQTTLEERQRHTLPSRLQGLSPEELRVQRGAEQRALEEKAHRDRQESEQQQARQQLQQWQEHERQRALQQPRAATQRIPGEGKEQRKKQPQPPPGQPPAQR